MGMTGQDDRALVPTATRDPRYDAGMLQLEYVPRRPLVFHSRLQMIRNRRQAVALHRLGGLPMRDGQRRHAGEVEQGRHHVDDMAELAADRSAIFELIGPREDEADPPAAAPGVGLVGREGGVGDLRPAHGIDRRAATAADPVGTFEIDLTAPSSAVPGRGVASPRCGTATVSPMTPPWRPPSAWAPTSRPSSRCGGGRSWARQRPAAMSVLALTTR